MAMPPYPIHCSNPCCSGLAQYKIAARWSDGVTEELKTYALCCGDCLPARWRSSRIKQATCRLAAGETLESPGVYLLDRGQRDQQLHRLADLEATFAAS
jgi:hypothetical protein